MSPFDSDVRLLAGASHAAYGDEEQFRAWAAGCGLDAEPFNETETDTQGFVAHNQRMRILAFRGTAGRKDWLLDANVERTNHLHGGFADAVEKSWERHIVPRLARAGAGPIHITGHSLGGALALLSARRLGASIAKLVTFGQPRAVDEVAAGECQSAFGDRYLRVVHDKDAVPRVPVFTSGYRHCGAVARIGGEKNTDLGSRTESFDDAVLMFTGHAISLPASAEKVLELVERRIDRIANDASRRIQSAGSLGDFFESHLPGGLKSFIDRFDDAINKSARAKSPGGLAAPEIFDDHKMLNYLAALER